MSETRTTTSAAERTAQHDAARRKALSEGMQQLEATRQVKNADFAGQLGKLQQAYQRSGEAWPTAPAQDSDEGVYARILKRTQSSEGMLPGYENVVLSYMNQEEMLRNTHAAIDPSVLGDNQEATVRELITEAEALPDDNEEKSRRLLSLNNVLVRMQPDAFEPRGDELATYVTNAEVHETTTDKNSRVLTERFLETSREELATVIENNEDDLRVLQLMAAKYPAPKPADAPANPIAPEARAATTEEPAPQAQTAEQQQAPAEKSKELLAAEQKLNGLRTQLADMNARREKKLIGTREARYSEKVKQLKAAYQAASRDVFNLQNPDFKDNQDIAHIDKVKMIADYTVSEAGKLDEQILESHKNNKTKLGKLLDWYGKRGVPAKLAVGVVGGMFIGAVTGGFGTAAWSGSMMAISLEARNRAKRQAGANMLQLEGKGGLLDTLSNRLDGKDGRMTLDTIDLDAAHDLLDSDVTGRNEKRISDAKRQRAIRIAGSYAAGATIGLITHNLPGGYLDGLHGPHDHVASAVSGHEGAGAAPDASHAAAAPDASHAAAPDAMHNVYTGPANVYVNPGDGFYKVFEQMHIPQDQWNTVLNKVGSSLVHHGDAYVMPDGGIGISSPGQMSPAVVDFIKNAANLR